MRRRILVALVALSGGLLLFPSSSYAQDQAEAKSRKIVNKVVPLYPELARRMQIHGTVKVETVIAPNGKVKSTHVIGGSPLLTQAAVDAIQKWRWETASQETKELIELNFHPE
ncbi:MAG TPA: energy transducer TonB [Terriglobales bacterium]|jgi:TonB family protein|nr:energy transducer TonB [Terriglobales bacterium]